MQSIFNESESSRTCPIIKPPRLGDSSSPVDGARSSYYSVPVGLVRTDRLFLVTRQSLLYQAPGKRRFFPPDIGSFSRTGATKINPAALRIAITARYGPPALFRLLPPPTCRRDGRRGATADDDSKVALATAQDSGQPLFRERHFFSLSFTTAGDPLCPRTDIHALSPAPI